MSKLTEADYDFSDVPQCELSDCLHYEYMRESSAIISEVSKVRRQILEEMKGRNTKLGDTFLRKIMFTKITGHPGFLFEAMILGILAGTETFPRLPWQKLSSFDKERLCNFPQKAAQIHNQKFREKNPMLLLDTIGKNPSLGGATLDAWKANRIPKQYQKVDVQELETILVSGFFQINMRYTHPQLSAAFSDWLKTNHPEGEKEPQERRGRNIQRDQLNALGALRLRFYCKTFTEAQTKMEPLRKKLNGMFYGDRRSFNRACDTAMRHFRTLLKTSEKDFPIHFTKGWQK